jgi:Spy/CpxP family protein refolding chaperone
MSVFERVRLLGFGVLAVTFIAGALAGAAIDRAATNPARAEARQARSQDGDRERSYIIDRVDMSDVQRASIDSILDRRVRRMRSVWEEVSPRLNAITDSARIEIMEVLTPEQQEEYESMLHRRGNRESGGDRSDSARAGTAGGRR